MKDKPHYYGHRQRLKEKLGKDSTSLADYEILELLLGQVLPRRDTKPLAKELLAEFGGLSGVFRAPEEQLKKFKGIGPGVLIFFTLMREFWTRIAEEPMNGKEAISSPDVVYKAAMARIGNLSKEEFWIALVNNRNKVICWERLSEGTVDKTAVYPREVVALALRHNASGVILTHNHPGGDPSPSPEDTERTMEIAALCQDMEIRLLDHVIVTADRFHSFKEAGYL
ncbi:RadC family protein [Maridesulfovibrio salexigens]|uniref:DNA repair protein RadC n=1 Tax=Maridesulfovibrio salexigens (strain ATCC 14822 / DSM 2638 / NCIMB 8403 / VKM B-1763) TaxID=526222 RepID=C6BYC2_MARSD|nr:DNA repair protein RadC [Maridesulfovibrio salexigens]ACS78713.1 DNA repair protein RadC [Maridesulfovibrio salexigens DSM 2638]